MAAIIDSSAIHAIFARPQTNGAYDGPVLDYLRGVGANRSLLLLAFAPKAAGTYFRQAAITALGGQLVRTVQAQGGRDATLYLPNVMACLLDRDAPHTVTHVHMQALAANRNFIEALGLKPVIMLRNVADMLASFWDMLEHDPIARLEGLNNQIPEGFVTLERARKADFLIDMVAPWYASYFATWKSFVDAAPRTVCVLRYQDLGSDPVEALKSALAHAGFGVSRATCAAAVAAVWADRQAYRYNKGVAGRGVDYFSAAQLEKLSRMLSYYPQLDAWMEELLPARHASGAGEMAA